MLSTDSPTTSHSRQILFRRLLLVVALGVIVQGLIVFVLIDLPVTSFGIATAVLIMGMLTYAGIVIITRIWLNTHVYIPLNNVKQAMEAIIEGVKPNVNRSNPALEEVHALYPLITRLEECSRKDIAGLKKHEQVRSAFIGNVSHELRTPIFAIQGYVETLLDGAIDDKAVARKFLEKVYSNTDRLNSLLRDLIDISRIESGEMRFSFRSFSIKDLVFEVCSSLEHVAANQDVSIKVSVNEGAGPSVLGDRDRLFQVLNNLVDNAIKYNRAGGTVTVGVTAEGDNAKITVKDTGMGISQEHINRIFERFYRVDEDRSRAVGGTGLGLSIVKHIIEAHNSTIHVESTPNEGTKCWFKLKLG